MRASQRLAVALIVGGSALVAGEASAQYRNFTFGFEGGYMYFAKDTQLKSNNFGLGIFGGWKGSDKWWFYGKGMLSFPGQQDNSPNTVIVLHAVPASVRYYFFTDSFRPWVGLTNAFNIFLNTTDAIRTTAWWGPGINAGVEFKLRRDLFLGFEADAFYMFNFDGPDAETVSATAQLIFFL